MFLIREDLQGSYPYIGQKFGGRDHTTAIHAYLKISEDLKNNSKLEEEIIAYWKENKTFEKSVSSRPKDKKWTFLDGPLFVTGMPHYGSLLSSLPKSGPWLETVKKSFGWLLLFAAEYLFIKMGGLLR